MRGSATCGSAMCGSECSCRRYFRRAVNGQVMAEFTLICVLLVLVLVVPWTDNMSPAEQLLQAVVEAAVSFRQWLLVV